MRWENELVALVKWECKVLNGEVGLGLEEGRGILIDEEMKRMSSFWGIVCRFSDGVEFECGSEVKWSEVVVLHLHLHCTVELNVFR